MNFPVNYYDFICKVRPYVMALAEQDANDLLEKGRGQEAIHSVDDYDSRFAQCLGEVERQTIERAMELTGASAEVVQRVLPEVQSGLRAHFTSLYHTVNHEYHCLVNFALSGKKTFHFSDNLSQHLANTEINLKAKLVQVPFTSCLFTFTSRDVVNAIHGIRRDAGRWDMNNLGLDYDAPVSVFVTMHGSKDGLPGRKLIIVAWHARPPAKSYIMLKRELYLADDWSLEQSLRTDWETLTPNAIGRGLFVDSASDSIQSVDDDAFYNDGLGFYRIILNAILYLSSDGAELTAKRSPREEIETQARAILSAPKRRKTLQTAARYSRLDYHEVGKSVGAIVVQPGHDNDERSAKIGIGPKPLVRFMVRGHWRQQPHGEGGLERKIIWILPHHKGPDMATLINRPYVVKKNAFG